MRTESLRKAYGEKVVELARNDERILSLDADLSGSTMSCLMQQAFPERYFEMLIAEQNMTAFATGLSLTGKIPFINTFAVFLTGRAFEQIRQSIGTAHANVKICGSSSGLSDFGDGASHQSVEDIAIMRSIPGMTILEPVDAVQTRKMVKSMVEYDGPVYLRINRADLPVITEESDEFEIGKIYEMRKGTDAVIFASGIMVSMSLEAADKLKEEGISLRVLNVCTIKPLDNDYIEGFTHNMKAVLTAEESSIIGGLNSLVSQAIAGKYLGPVVPIGVEDRFGYSSLSYEDLLESFGFTSENIIDKVKKALGL